MLFGSEPLRWIIKCEVLREEQERRKISEEESESFSNLTMNNR
jgi:hypothetical protein